VKLGLTHPLVVSVSIGMLVLLFGDGDSEEGENESSQEKKDEGDLLAGRWSCHVSWIQRFGARGWNFDGTYRLTTT
jgi:hypothetical protein